MRDWRGNAITNHEKIEILQELYNSNLDLIKPYYDALEKMNDMKYNYTEILTEGCNIELERLTEKDYNQSCALLTMLLREDYFCYDSFKDRVAAGDVKKVLKHMIRLLEKD